MRNFGNVKDRTDRMCFPGIIDDFATPGLLFPFSLGVFLIPAVFSGTTGYAVKYAARISNAANVGHALGEINR